MRSFQLVRRLMALSRVKAMATIALSDNLSRVLIYAKLKAKRVANRLA